MQNAIYPVYVYGLSHHCHPKHQDEANKKEEEEEEEEEE